MTRGSKFILWLLSGFVTLIALAIVSFVVWRVNLSDEVNIKLAAIR